ncbi:MAG: hypothetical protein K0S41_3840 [Anaerocolumna sp.]|jgi:ABC-2 type transport system permease protein|nr:hypothetical protein [Anaerocolumna sp.]
MLYLLKKDFKELLVHKKRIVLSFIVLIILIIGTSYHVNKKDVTFSTAKIGFGVIDNDNSSYSKLLLDYFKKSESFSSYINIVQNDSKEIERLFQNGELDIYLEIPKDFAKNMIYMKHLPIKVNINSADTTKALLLKNVLESYEKYIRAVEVNCITLYDLMEQKNMDLDLIYEKNIEISYDLIFTALGKETFFSYNEENEFPSTSLQSYYTYGVIFFVLFYISFYIGFLNIKERKQGIMQRLLSTGLSVNSFLLEKIIFGVIVLSLVIGFFSITFNFDHKVDVNLKMNMFYFISVLFCVSFSVFLSECFQDIQVYILSGNVIGFFFNILGGSIIPIMYLPKQIQTLSKFTPNYWFIKIMTSFKQGLNIGIYYTIVFFLITCSICFYLLSVKIVKVRGKFL